MRRHSSFGSTLLLLAVTASPVASQAERRHPDEAFVAPAPRTVSVTLGDPSGKAAPPSGRRTLVGTIGTENGPEATLFGNITQATFLDDSTVAILDQATPDVRLFSVTGRHLETVGRSGGGPGEFQLPLAVVSSPSGELLIADLRRNIQLFRTGPQGFEHRQTWQLPFSPRSMCFVGQRLFVNATMMEKPTVIHELTDDGKVINSFGEVYRSPNKLINYQTGQGRIVCDARRQLIYLLAGNLMGEVRAFRLTGELAWRVRASDYRNNIVEDTPGGMSVTGSPHGVHIDAGLALIEGHGVLAMWAFRSAAQMDAKEAPTLTHMVLIDPVTGSAISQGNQATMVTDVRGSLRLELSEDPFPRVEVHRSSLPWPTP